MLWSCQTKDTTFQGQICWGYIYDAFVCYYRSVRPNSLLPNLQGRKCSNPNISTVMLTDISSTKSTANLALHWNLPLIEIAEDVSLPKFQPSQIASSPRLCYHIVGSRLSRSFVLHDRTVVHVESSRLNDMGDRGAPLTPTPAFKPSG